MERVSYDGAAAQVGSEIVAAHRGLWDRLARAGTWFTGAERVAIAAEARAADVCALCRARKAAISPYAVEGQHDSLPGTLGAGIVEVVHRVRTDPGRLSRRFYDEARASGVGEEQYVEIVGIVVQLTNVDSFCRGVGRALHPLPDPVSGEPTRRRPERANPGLAWVATIAPAYARGPEADLYPRLPHVPNVLRALSLVPDEVRGIMSLSDAQYVPMVKLMELTAQRTLTRPQMELVAGRVSALNQCFY
jgi:hypothetical protein